MLRGRRGIGMIVCSRRGRHAITVSLVLATVAWSTLGWAARPRRLRRSGSSANLPEATRLINQRIRAGWEDYGLTPSPRATDGEWCRRLFLDVLGRIPTVEELREFTTSHRADKRHHLVNRLLDEQPYLDRYVRNWTTVWTNILIGRTGGTERRSLTSREGLKTYLRRSLSQNKPYDRMVHELISAKGTTVVGSKQFNGATNFLISKVTEEKATQATAATAKIFLGMQVQCTQCHNHPFNDWKQRKFWEMNAFFRQTRAIRHNNPESRTIAYAELVDRDFRGEGQTPDEAEIYYELRNGEMQVAYPVFVDGSKINRSGFVSKVDRREELAKLVVNSPMLEKMIVNRMWAHFLGYGFTEPIDDLGVHNTPSHPKLMDGLAREFRKASFNTKDLIRWITLSEPYALSSRTNKTNVESDDPSLGEPPKFSRFYLRHMNVEQLYDSLLVATEAEKTQRDRAQQDETKSRWLRQFSVAFGTDEGGEQTMFDGTIPQTLMMFNGELTKRAIALDAGNMLGKVVDSEMKPADKINYLYQAGLARKASKDEIAVANQLLLIRKGNAAEALQDIWWAILNSNEFILNH